MARKQDNYYFENFVHCVEHALGAAELLEATFKSFDPDNLKQSLEAIHEREHAADCLKHELMETLAKAFITPIEREDILALSQNIDEMVDKIEDVLIRIYCTNTRTIRPDAQFIASLIVKCCGAVLELMKELPNFRHSKTLQEKVIAINTLEEAADTQYIAALRDLHTDGTEPKEVFAWHEIYGYLEKCMDACEHAADVVESIVMKNS